MKLRLLFLILLLGWLGKGFGQKTLSRHQYEIIIDHVNCEVTKYVLEKEGRMEILEAYKTMATYCDYVNIMEFLKTYQPTLRQNAYLATRIEQNKYNFDSATTNAQLYNLTTEIFKDSALIQFDQTADFKPFKTSLQLYLEENMKINEILPEEEEPWSFPTFGGTGSRFATILVYVFLGGIVFFVFYRLRKGLNYLTQNTQVQSPTQKKAGNNSADEKFVSEKLEEQRKKEEEAKAKPRGIPEEVEQEEVEQEISRHFFMTRPRIDGSFYNFDRSPSFQEAASIFEFKVVSEKYQIAQFYVVNRPELIEQILMEYEKLLEPVCKKSNEVKPGIRQILTVEPGLVQLSGNHWRLKRKAVIRFE